MPHSKKRGLFSKVVDLIPFPMCDKKYNFEYAVNFHIRVSHQSCGRVFNEWRCSICLFVCNFWSQLAKHKKDVHKLY